jgi:hypothetical protein
MKASNCRRADDGYVRTIVPTTTRAQRESTNAYPLPIGLRQDALGGVGDEVVDVVEHLRVIHAVLEVVVRLLRGLVLELLLILLLDLGQEDCAQGTEPQGQRQEDGRRTHGDADGVPLDERFFFSACLKLNERWSSDLW